MVIRDFRKDLSRFTTTSASCVLRANPVFSHLNSLRLQPLRYVWSSNGSALDGVEFTGSVFLWGTPRQCDARRFSITSSPSLTATPSCRSTTTTPCLRRRSCGCLYYCGEECALPPTCTQSKTFTAIVPFVPHLSVAPSCDVFNLLVSTILKPRTLVVLVVSFDGLSLTRAGSSIISPVPLSTIYNNPVTDVGGTPLQGPDLFFKNLRRKASSSDIPLSCFLLSILHVWPPPPFRSFKLRLKGSLEDSYHQPPQTYLLSQRFVNLVSDVGGNPLRHLILNHLFMNLASDVGGNPLRLCWHTTLTSSSNVKGTSLPCLLSMNGEKIPDSFLSFSFSLLTGLLPCGAVRSGPEGAIETTSVFLVGEDCLSTSLVTISQLSDYVVEALSTHSNLVLNSLSTSYEDLSCLLLFAIVVHELFTRGCLIPSWFCSPCF
ncbi:hypothetical protein Bca52824_007535 [Brassica carinata]|uniref:Uncharacterized protein n=1 Tax=Brassica carinata TaxID=52824 RepID=A0A8X8B8A5_BRACI|nr:hypothetical protein Bca52824_007535 [Brassica carinata]